MKDIKARSLLKLVALTMSILEAAVCVLVGMQYVLSESSWEQALFSCLSPLAQVLGKSPLTKQEDVVN